MSHDFLRISTLLYQQITRAQHLPYSENIEIPGIENTQRWNKTAVFQKGLNSWKYGERKHEITWFLFFLNKIKLFKKDIQMNLFRNKRSCIL